MQDRASNTDLRDEIRLLKIQLGNLEVQIADYRQIVKELSDKLRLYEEINGSVFQPARK